MELDLSEEDIRNKIVYQWLKFSGISDSSILIEHNLKLQIGKGVKVFHSRTDILVKSDDGRNLLIVEVKKPNHKLVDNDKLQALSYSRTLVGGIAPFTILTNGLDSKIYDSVSGELISNVEIPKNHPYLHNNFIPTGASIEARMEALQYLITLTEENLLIFCEGQLEYRIKNLKGEDINSGKKYIPKLYVERSNANKELKKKIFDGQISHGLILVVGPPQHGKTCFMCDTARKFLKDGNPTFFYSANNLNKGLLNSIQEDLGWCFNENMPPHSWIYRLNNVANSIGKRIFIFIDGWNELSQNALDINDECRRLELQNIVIILSTTSPSVLRLLQDNAGNPTYVAEKINIGLPLLKTLATQRLLNISPELGIVQIGKFTIKESEQAKLIHSQAFDVNFRSDENILIDPFYIRIASEIFQGEKTIENITKTALIKEILLSKGARRGIGNIDLYSKLEELATVFFTLERPVSILDLPKRFQNQEDIELLTESSILIIIESCNEIKVDFYFTHELNFSIGQLHRKWSEKFRKEKYYKSELEISCRTETGKEALRWFFGLPENGDFIQKIFQSLNIESYFSTVYGRLLVDSILEQTLTNPKYSSKWLEKHLEAIVKTNADLYDEDYLPKLIFSFLKSFNRNKNKELYRFWVRLLVKYEDIFEIGISESYLNLIYNENIYSYDWYLDGELDVVLFEKFLLDEEVADKARYILARCCPYHYLESTIPKIITYSQIDINELLGDTYNLIISQIEESYYGEMCPGRFSNLEKGSEEIIEEYTSQKQRWFPLMQKIDSRSAAYTEILSFLQHLRNLALISPEDDEIIPYNDPNQLKLDL